MIKQLIIVKRKEDNEFIVPFRGINTADYDSVTPEEFIEAVESASSWNEIREEVYAKTFEEFGLDLYTYEDPDVAWEDFLKAVSINKKKNKKNKKKILRSTIINRSKKL